MKTTTYKIESGKLIAYYETYRGKKGVKTFELDKFENGTFSFKEAGTQYRLRVNYCNLCKCYTAFVNNTELSSFINADLKTLVD